LFNFDILCLPRTAIKPQSYSFPQRSDQHGKTSTTTIHRDVDLGIEPCVYFERTEKSASYHKCGFVGMGEGRHCLGAAVLTPQWVLFKVCFVRPYSFFHDVLGSTPTTTTPTNRVWKGCDDGTELGVVLSSEQTGREVKTSQSMGSSLM
jgi:hypothetical protein